ncbi:MAG: serine/threonine-protein kinase [Oligoflexia bacterium]|nr:serine/threonine-protein kinase [Oligoflexia bacterium]
MKIIIIAILYLLTFNQSFALSYPLCDKIDLGKISEKSISESEEEYFSILVNDMVLSRLRDFPSGYNWSKCCKSSFKNLLLISPTKSSENIEDKNKALCSSDLQKSMSLNMRNILVSLNQKYSKECPPIPIKYQWFVQKFCYFDKKSDLILLKKILYDFNDKDFNSLVTEKNFKSKLQTQTKEVDLIPKFCKYLQLKSNQIILVGSGGIKSVFLRENESGQLLAFAKMKQNGKNDSTYEKERYTCYLFNKITEEIKLLKEKGEDIGLMFVLSFRDLIIKDEFDGENKNYFECEMEYYSKGDLANAKIKNEKLQKRYIQNLLTGLYALHRNNIVHRDIKPDNIFLTRKKAVIGDYGLAFQDSPNLNPIIRKRKGEGTPDYIAPEYWQYMNAKGTDDGFPFELEKTSDVWALGASIFQMIDGNTLVEAAFDGKIVSMMMIKKEDQIKIDSAIDKLKTSKKNKDLLKKMLKIDSKERISIKESYDLWAID